MADDTEWMTYDALAEKLGISGESARNLVRRRRWQRRQGNDGIAVVAVPVDYIAARVAEAAEPPAIPPTADTENDDRGEDNVPHDPAITLALTALGSHIERQAAEIDRLQAGTITLAAERDAAREAIADLRVQMAEVQARAIAAEVRAADHAAERDRWSALATAPRGIRAWIATLHQRPRVG